MDATFGNWLAGFIDGEGCFVVSDGGRRLKCQFVLHLRADELPILEEIVERTGIGRVAVRPQRGTSNPAALWVVRNRPDCLALVALLDRFPLRARKLADFVAWRAAVLAWAQVRRGSTAVIPANRPHWDRMRECRATLNESRLWEAA